MLPPHTVADFERLRLPPPDWATSAGPLPSGPADPDAQQPRTLHEMAASLRAGTDLQALLRLARRQPVGAPLLDDAGRQAVEAMAQAWEQLRRDLARAQGPSRGRGRSGLPAGLAQTVARCAQAVEDAADEEARCREAVFGPALPVAELDAPPLGARLIGLVGRYLDRPKDEILQAIREEHGHPAYTHRLFHHAWMLAQHPAFRRALIALWRHTRAPVGRCQSWSELDEIEGKTAQAMRAVRDWQAARLEGSVPPPAGGVPDAQDLMRVCQDSSRADLSSILRFVYPQVPDEAVVAELQQQWRALPAACP